ncbi:MAG: hypothetical protein M3Y56_11910 [Armatimonadota bacterium]|nr:hypothetical protein [Armatimonadota bacterium]
MMLALASLCGLAAFVLAIYGIIWIYKDAQARGDNPVLWAVLTFFFSALVLLIYGIMKGSKTGIILGVAIFVLVAIETGSIIGGVMPALQNGHYVTTTSTTTPSTTTP